MAICSQYSMKHRKASSFSSNEDVIEALQGLDTQEANERFDFLQYQETENVWIHENKSIFAHAVLNLIGQKTSFFLRLVQRNIYPWFSNLQR